MAKSLKSTQKKIIIPTTLQNAFNHGLAICAAINKTINSNANGMVAIVAYLHA